MIQLLVCLALVPGDSDPDSERVPGCGVACLYYVARSHGLDVTLNKIEDHVHALYPEADLSKLSIEQVESAGRNLGLHLRAVKVDRNSIRRVPLPAIVYIRSERLRRSAGEVGHMVLLTGATADHARLFDPNGGESQEYTWDAFWTGYDGELLASIDAVFGVPVHRGFLWAAILTGIAGCWVTLYWLYSITRRGTNKLGARTRVASLLLVLALAATGCGKRGAPPPPLSFDNDMQDLGDVTDVSEVACNFRFTVNDEKGVTIRALSPSCSCILINSDDLVGRALARGTEGTIRLTVRGKDSAGDLEGRVLVQTEPEMPTPITLGFRAKIHAALMQVRSCPTKLRMLPHQSARFNVVLERLRATQSANLSFDAECSVNPRYRILDHRIRESVVEAFNIQSKPAVRETHTFSVEAAPMSQVGERTGRLSISWREANEKGVNIDITSAIEHPLRLRQESLFLGYLEPGQVRESFLAAIDPEVMQKEFREINSSEKNCSATYDRARGGVKIKVVAPQSVGRFRYIFSLQSAKGTPFEHLPLELPVSGIVGNP